MYKIHFAFFNNHNYIYIFISILINLIIIYFYRVSVKQVRLCNENDIVEKNKKNIENILLWDTNEPVEFYRSIPYLNVVPRWYINQKIEGKSFCFIVEDVGWYYNLELIYN